jgi:hypothetical protein
MRAKKSLRLELLLPEFRVLVQEGVGFLHDWKHRQDFLIYTCRAKSPAIEGEQERYREGGFLQTDLLSLGPVTEGDPCAIECTS